MYGYSDEVKKQEERSMKSLKSKTISKEGFFIYLNEGGGYDRKYSQSRTRELVARRA